MRAAAKRVKERSEALGEDARGRVTLEFVDVEGQVLAERFDTTLDTPVEVLREVLARSLAAPDERYAFFFENYELQRNVKELLVEFGAQRIKNELNLRLRYMPETPFRVQPVTRISSSLDGHTQPVLDVSFAPNGRVLASAAGDRTVRLWDALTETGLAVLPGHASWVLAVAWAPTSALLAAGEEGGAVSVWRVKALLDDCKALKDPAAVARQRVACKGHSGYVSSLSWRPFHLEGGAGSFVSGSKDCTVRVWCAGSGRCLHTGLRHSKAVTRVFWGGEDRIYSCSQDQSVVVWDASAGFLMAFGGHAHWVNCIALNTHHALKAAYNDFEGLQAGLTRDAEPAAALRARAGQLYAAALKLAGRELVATASDDHTLMVFDCRAGEKHVLHCTGHTAPVNHVQFAPNCVTFVSAAFDKTLRVWNVHVAGCLAMLRGHVAQVYMLAFSRDSRWLVSGSKDSTLQVWSLKERKRAYQLPGHADEVYAVDWSPDGQRLASGGKDRAVRVWRA